jgi:hypothetical protein
MTCARCPSAPLSWWLMMIFRNGCLRGCMLSLQAFTASRGAFVPSGHYTFQSCRFACRVAGPSLLGRASCWYRQLLHYPVRPLLEELGTLLPEIGWGESGERGPGRAVIFPAGSPRLPTRQLVAFLPGSSGSLGNAPSRQPAAGPSASPWHHAVAISSPLCNSGSSAALLL